jgi:hypothetical protein
MLYEKEFSYDVRVVLHTFYAAPQTTLDAGVQDVAHQALIAFCQELQDLDNQWLSEMDRKYMQKIEDLRLEGYHLKDSNITRSELHPEGYHPKLTRVAMKNW